MPREDRNCINFSVADLLLEMNFIFCLKALCILIIMQTLVLKISSTTFNIQCIILYCICRFMSSTF